MCIGEMTLAVTDLRPWENTRYALLDDLPVVTPRVVARAHRDRRAFSRLHC